MGHVYKKWLAYTISTRHSIHLLTVATSYTCSLILKTAWFGMKYDPTME